DLIRISALTDASELLQNVLCEHREPDDRPAQRSFFVEPDCQALDRCKICIDLKFGDGAINRRGLRINDVEIDRGTKRRFGVGLHKMGEQRVEQSEIDQARECADVNNDVSIIGYPSLKVGK